HRPPPRSLAPEETHTRDIGSQQLGEEGGRTGSAVRLHRAVIDRTADLGGDGVSECVGSDLVVVQAAAGSVSAKPVGDVEVLLEVVAQRGENERSAGGGELHAGGQAALDD